MTAAEDRLGEIEGRLSDAHEEIGNVAANVREHWRMSIPARPEYDTDLIISRALDEGERVAAALRAVLAECAYIEEHRGLLLHPEDLRDAITAALTPAEAKP